MTDDLHRIAAAIEAANIPSEVTLTISAKGGEISTCTSEGRIVSLLRAQLTEAIDIDGLAEDEARGRLVALEELCADVLEGEHPAPAKALAVRVLETIRSSGG